MSNRNPLFAEERRESSRMLAILACAAASFSLGIVSLQAHEPGSGPKYRAGSVEKAFAPSPQTASPVTDGLWTTLPYLMPINPIHCALLHDGKVLVVAGSENTLSEHQAGQYYAAVWDTQAGTFSVQNLLWDIFCSGMAGLADGRFLVIGGSAELAPPYGDARATVFDPATEKFTQVESMVHGRWYGSVIELSDGGLMAFLTTPEEGRTTRPSKSITSAAVGVLNTRLPGLPPFIPGCTSCRMAMSFTREKQFTQISSTPLPRPGL